MDKKVVKRSVFSYLFLAIIIISVLWFMEALNTKVNELSYSEFLKKLGSGEVTELTINQDVNKGVYTLTGKLKDYKEKESFVSSGTLSEETLKQINEVKGTNELEIKVSSDPQSSYLLFFIVNILPILIMAGIIMAAYYFISRQMGTANKSMDFGRSRARLTSDKDKVKFDKVAGLTEEKEEVQELIDFLKEPKKFKQMGARIPKGVLLVGPPGTGKTLLAKAVAGEANVPFYFISGSDFVELFVGVGASRVRDMFKQAKQNAPCLIFIDEIDAVGRQRGTGLGGGHDEREQTLNQLLTEMDGFGANEGIIVIAATNRPDVLDPALLRPGRFDRQITVNYPDVKGREEILKVHAKGKTFAKNVKLENIAKSVKKSAKMYKNTFYIR